MSSYHNVNTYPASHGLSGSSTTAISQNGLGQWWSANFPAYYKVDKVRILNTNNQPGERLADTSVSIINVGTGETIICGQVTSPTV